MGEGLIYDLSFGAFWVWSLSSMFHPAVRQPEGPPDAFFAVFMAMGIVMIIAFAIPPVVIIRSVRSETVRKAMVLRGA